MYQDRKTVLSDRHQAWRNPSYGFVGQLSIGELMDLERAKVTSVYPAGAHLFAEGDTPRGVYLLCEGEAKLYVSSSEGKTFAVRIARAGEALGLFPLLCGHSSRSDC